MIKALFKHIYKYYKDTFILAIAGVVIGVLVGIIDAAFGLGLNACTAIRTKYFWYLIWFLPLGGCSSGSSITSSVNLSRTA